MAIALGHLLCFALTGLDWTLLCFPLALLHFGLHNISSHHLSFLPLAHTNALARRLALPGTCALACLTIFAPFLFPVNTALRQRSDLSHTAPKTLDSTSNNHHGTLQNGLVALCLFGLFLFYHHTRPYTRVYTDLTCFVNHTFALRQTVNVTWINVDQHAKTEPLKHD